MVVSLAACGPKAQVGGTAAYRYASGGALSRVGVSSGGTGSIYLSDRGGPISRSLMLLVELLASPGIFHDVQTTTYVDDRGDALVVHRTTTATVDPEELEDLTRATKLLVDPDVSFAERHAQGYSGLTGSIEIASRNLGGDTSGWRFGVGYEKKEAGRIGYEAVAKLAAGSFTLHDRTLTGYDDVTAMPLAHRGDVTAPFLGFDLRLGVVYTPSPRTSFGTSVEAFVAPDLNFLALLSDDKDPTQNTPASVWRLGVRLTTAAYAYVEATYAVSRMDADHTSWGLEVGVAF